LDIGDGAADLLVVVGMTVVVGFEEIEVVVGAGLLVLIRMAVVVDFEEIEVVVGVGLLVGAVVDFDVGTAVGPTEDDVEDESLKERYQFVRLVSPRHSPTVTPFHPFC